MSRSSTAEPIAPWPTMRTVLSASASWTPGLHFSRVLRPYERGQLPQRRQREREGEFGGRGVVHAARVAQQRPGGKVGDGGGDVVDPRGEGLHDPHPVICANGRTAMACPFMYGTT